MPQYDYRCQDCRQPFTIERSMSDNSDPLCTGCGSANAARIWNAFIIAGGTSQDVGQGMSGAPAAKKSGCGSCSSHACGTCH